MYAMWIERYLADAVVRGRFSDLEDCAEYVDSKWNVELLALACMSC